MVIKPDPSIIDVGGLFTPGDACDGRATGSGGSHLAYFTSSVANLAAGAPVSIADDNGKTVGSATLGAGRWETMPNSNPYSKDNVCRMRFSASVRSTSKFYRVKVADRPEQTAPAGRPVEVTVQG